MTQDHTGSWHGCARAVRYSTGDGPAVLGRGERRRKEQAKHRKTDDVFGRRQHHDLLGGGIHWLIRTTRSKCFQGGPIVIPRFRRVKTERRFEFSSEFSL